MADTVKNLTNISKIKAFVTDIDGVLTDGGMIPTSDGDLLRIVDAKDSFALRFAGLQGYITGVISGGKTEALMIRCRNYKIKEENIFLGARGKLATFRKFCEQNGLQSEEVAYFGDDIADIQVLRECGLGIVPSDAADEAKDVADVISERAGGNLVLRKGIEMVMKAHGTWVFDENNFDKLY